MTMEFRFPRDAACHPINGYAGDLDVFFPAGEPGTPGYDRDVRAAKDICAACPVATACLVDALDAGHEFGVFGGMDAPERLALIATPVDVLLERHATENARREAERIARLRAAVRPLVEGRTAPRAPRERRPRTGGTCPTCGVSTWTRVKTGGMSAHEDRRYGGPCEGIDRPPRTDRNIYTEGSR